jgi:hypothetical protein
MTIAPELQIQTIFSMNNLTRIDPIENFIRLPGFLFELESSGIFPEFFGEEFFQYRVFM